MGKKFEVRSLKVESVCDPEIRNPEFSPLMFAYVRLCLSAARWAQVLTTIPRRGACCMGLDHFISFRLDVICILQSHPHKRQ